jgi:hypothetical protein
MRSFGQAKMVAPKFLSDSLNLAAGNWYGSWAASAGISIAYNNLPTGEALARLYSPMNNSDVIYFDFKDIQNINGLYLDFYYKGATADPRCYIYFSQLTGLAGPRYRKLLNADGATPIVWTRALIPVEYWGTLIGSTLIGPSCIGSTIRSIGLLTDAIAAPPVQMEIANFTIRRL